MGLLLLSGAAQAAFTAGPAVGGGAAAWVDFNNDGFTDLYDGSTLWRNDGGSNLVSVTGFGGSGVWADYDNDGLLDVYRWASNGQLYRNDGNEIFSVVTTPTLPDDTGGTQANVSRGASWGDHDGDGYADLYVGGYEIWSPSADFPDAWLRNNAAASFSMTEGSALRARGVTSCDFDEDGDIDIYVSNYRLQVNLLWRNDGGGSFSEVAATYGVRGQNQEGAYGHTIGSAWGDMNNDGHIDLFVGNFAHPDWYQDRARLYENDGPPNHHFTERWVLDGGDYQESYASPAIGDYDNDGDQDLYFTTVYAGDNARLYRNDGGWSFVDVTGAENLGGMPSTYQAAWADYDNDGDLDLVTGGNVHVNNASGNGNHWLKVRLKGDGAQINRAAIGAQVRIDLGGGTILVRQVEAGTGEGNQNDLTLHFGLGSRTAAVDLDILWPNGDTQTVSGVAVDGTAQISAGPEVTNAGGATNITHDSATLRGYLVDAGGGGSTALVGVYWGPADGGESSWQTNYGLGPKVVGPLSQAVSGLTPNTHYYYRFYATNDMLGAWASPSAEFITGGTVPFSETFDTLTPGDIHGQHGWEVSLAEEDEAGRALVQPDQTYGGSTRACSVSNAELTHAFSGPGAASTVVWTDLYVVPVPASSPGAIPSNSTGKAIFLVDADTGALAAMDGDALVLFTNEPAVPTAEWVRFTTRMDHGSKTWDLWMNATTVVYNLAFHATNTPGLSRLTLLDRFSSQASFVDNVTISLDRPDHILTLDSDADDLDDDWERDHFNSLEVSDGGPDDDWDGDWFIDLYEFLANTDPTDTNSLLVISNAWPEATDEFVLEWQSASNQTYSIERSTNLLVADWAALVSNLPAIPPLNRYTVTMDEADSFYRIKLD